MVQGRHQGIQGFIGKPLDVEERITHKLGEIARLKQLAEQYPNDPCYKLAIERAKNELHQLQSNERKQ